MKKILAIFSLAVLVFMTLAFLTVRFPSTVLAACPASYDTVVRVDATKPGQNLCTANSDAVGFDTIGKSGTSIGGQCGDFSCNGAGNRCVVNISGTCYVGSGNDGYKIPNCKANSPLVKTSCPPNLRLQVRAEDQNGNGISGATFTVYYGLGINSTNTNGTYSLTLTTDANGNAVDTTHFYSGTNYYMLASKTGYTFTNPQRWSSTINTFWSCGSQRYDGVQNAPCIAVGTPWPTISGNVHMDYANNGSNNGAYTGGATITVTDAGGKVTGTAITDGSGNYSVSIPANGRYTVSLSPPVNNPIDAATTNPQQVTITNANRTANFGLTTVQKITGRIYIDTNNSQTYQSTDTLYTGSSSISITGPVNITIPNITSGIYDSSSVKALTPGQYTVTYSSPPLGYYMSYPQTSTPPSFIVKVGQNGVCTTNGANDATCVAGDIINLDFGITNAAGWMQSFCGDVRSDSGITNLIPANPVCGTTTGAYMIQTAANICTNPGIAFSGSNNANFGQGQASSTNWVAGSSGNPELYKRGSQGIMRTSYTSLTAQMRQSGLTPIDLSTKCTLTNCTLPANLPHGLYQATGDVTLQGFTFPVGQNYVFLINGNLDILGNISVPVGSTALFSASGNITVDKSVGVATPTTLTSNLDGFYSTDQSFIVASTGSCTDQRLNIAGSVVVNAALKGGSFQNNRNLCANNSSCPTISFTQRPDFLINAPSFLTYTNHIWQEVPPGFTPPTATPIVFTPTPTIKLTSTPTPTIPVTTPPVKEVASTAHISAATTSISWPHQITHANNILLVGISSYSSGASSVKYGSASLIKIASATNGGQAYSEIWYLSGISPQTSNVIVTFPSSTAVVAGSVSFYNVDPLHPIGIASSSNGNSKNASNTLNNTNIDQMIFDNFAYPANIGGWNTGQALLWQNSVNNGGGASYKAGTAGTTIVTWTNSNSTGENWADVAVPIN